MKYSVIIPVHNEQKNVSLLNNKIRSTLKNFDFETIFVDDGSTDKTYLELKKIQAIKIIKHDKRYGQTTSLLSGFDHAQGDIVITLDGDLQNDPIDIPKLISNIGKNVDVCCGWRSDRQDKKSKVIESKIAYYLRSLILNDKIHDSGCTLRAYKKECIKDLNLKEGMHRFLPAILSHKGYKIKEIEVNHSCRLNGQSKYGPKRLLQGARDILLLKYSFAFNKKLYNNKKPILINKIITN